MRKPEKATTKSPPSAFGTQRVSRGYLPTDTRTRRIEEAIGREEWEVKPDGSLAIHSKASIRQVGDEALEVRRARARRIASGHKAVALAERLLAVKPLLGAQAPAGHMVVPAEAWEALQQEARAVTEGLRKPKSP